MKNTMECVRKQSLGNQTSGFTLVELMVVLTILGIVASVALPSFKSTLSRNRVVSQLNEIAGVIAYARSEASKSTNSKVTLCISNDINASSPSCGDSSDNAWDAGWIVFSDENENGTIDGDETLLRVGQVSASDIIIRSSGFAQNGRITFENGIPGTGGTFAVCSTSESTPAKAIVISVAGQSRVAVDEDHDGIVNDESGSNVSCTLG